jgi:hypothetical protein
MDAILIRNQFLAPCSVARPVIVSTQSTDRTSTSIRVEASNQTQPILTNVV